MCTTASSVFDPGIFLIHASVQNSAFLFLVTVTTFYPSYIFPVLSLFERIFRSVASNFQLSIL